jgi:hypothetical protein
MKAGTKKNRGPIAEAMGTSVSVEDAVPKKGTCANGYRESPLGQPDEVLQWGEVSYGLVIRWGEGSRIEPCSKATCNVESIGQFLGVVNRVNARR